MTVVSELTSQVGVAAACQALAVPRSSFYRSRQSSSPKADSSLTVDTSPTIDTSLTVDTLPTVDTSPKVDPPSPPARSPRSLNEEEKSVVRETLNSPRFRDQAPREVYATLLDEQRYLCSWRTMYRILDQHQEVRERRAQLRHPNYAKPENEHYHSSLGSLTPATVHYGQAAALLEKRQRVLDAAYAAHPERFVKKPPTVQSLPDAVWINRPQPLLEAGAEPPLGV